MLLCSAELGPPLGTKCRQLGLIVSGAISCHSNQRGFHMTRSEEDVRALLKLREEALSSVNVFEYPTVAVRCVLPSSG
jgi:hypothetical protein